MAESDWQVKTPVVLILFNRSDTAERVFQAIRHARPTKLFVIADGARLDRPNEVQQCAAARAVVDQLDWDCEVFTNYSDVNLGCNQRVSSGLNWVFNTVETAIILEDDCLPDPTFFRFCDDLLEHYRQDTRIMTISGDNFQFGRQRTDYSYYLSRYNHCWGWATWRRAWQYYDADMKLWTMVRDSGWLRDILMDSSAVRYWTKIFQSVYENRINSWAYRWTFACWLQSGLTILPNVNLISNIGFGQTASHTTDANSLANLPVESVHFPLNHPPFIIPDWQADTFTQKTIFQQKLVVRIREKLKQLIQS